MLYGTSGRINANNTDADVVPTEVVAATPPAVEEPRRGRRKATAQLHDSENDGNNAIVV
jgi:hypothetical protein